MVAQKSGDRSTYFGAIEKKHGQPMRYWHGVMAGKNHILIAPWNPSVIKKFAPKLKTFEVNKKTIRVPSDWEVDAKLLQAMVKECLAQSD